LAPKSEEIKYFVPDGRKYVRGRTAEFLKASPDMVDACFNVTGRFPHRGNTLLYQPVILPPMTDRKSGESAALTMPVR